MKTKIYAFLCVLLVGSLWVSDVAAQRSRNDCELILESVDNTPITAEINGRRFDRTGTTLRFGNMPSGRKNIIIYRVSGHRRDGGATARIIWEGRLITKRGVQTIGSVDAYSGQVRFRNYVLGDDGYRTADSRQNGGTRGDDDSRYRGTSDARESLPVRDRDQNRRDQDASNNSAQNTSDIEARWNNLEKAVNDKITDTDKLKALKESIGQERISTANLRRSMGWLSFETTKLEWAKYKIADVADPENLASISSDFTFSSNQKAFEEAVSKRRR
jgi:hypothetical protein